jgi:anti-anti-sigma factor
MAAAEVASQLSRALQEAAQQRPRVLAVDLSGLAFISSTGLGGLVAAHITCQKNGSRFVLVSPKPLIQEILDVTKLNTLLRIVDSVDEAAQLAESQR